MIRGFWKLFGDSIREYGKKFGSVFNVFLLLYLLPLIAIGILFFIFLGSYSDIGLSFLESGTLNWAEFAPLSFAPLFNRFNYKSALYIP